jgi:LPXTG-motif cell wall-anchored protein
VLPDTGGPNVVWLLLGLALVGGGGGLVIAARRRPRGSLYDV